MTKNSPELFKIKIEPIEEKNQMIIDPSNNLYHNDPLARTQMQQWRGTVKRPVISCPSFRPFQTFANRG